MKEENLQVKEEKEGLIGSHKANGVSEGYRQRCKHNPTLAFSRKNHQKHGKQYKCLVLFS